jgi:hypothetical protein
MIDMLQEAPGDFSRQEIAKEITGLDDRQQAELVALFWIGRGDFEPEEWETAVTEAAERREVPTPVYLMGQPLLSTIAARTNGARQVAEPCYITLTLCTAFPCRCPTRASSGCS